MATRTTGDILDTVGACVLLEVTVPELRHAMAEQGLPFRLVGGRRLRFTRGALERWVRESQGLASDPESAELITDRRPIKRSVRFAVLKRCGYACAYCGRRPPEVVLELDHILPVVRGGTNRPDNLTAACRDCNRGKYNREA
jgi:hypothetical protein